MKDLYEQFHLSVQTKHTNIIIPAESAPSTTIRVNQYMERWNCWSTVWKYDTRGMNDILSQNRMATYGNFLTKNPDKNSTIPFPIDHE